MCTSIDVTETIDKLEEPDSVPSEVVNEFYQEVSNEDELASGDINGVLEVIDKAVEVRF